MTEKTNNINFNLVDFHAHILPGADHGSKNQADSIHQLAYAGAVGVKRIIATPHFYPHYHIAERFLLRREKAYKSLCEVLEDNSPQIRLGAEVLLCENLNKLPELSELCIYGTKTMLLELPFSDISDAHVATVSEIISQGYNIVLAHADKYNPKDIEKFIPIGVKLQLNADAFLTLFKRTTLYEWLEKDLVVAFGSDIHRRDKGAYKRFAKAITKLNGSLDTVYLESDKIWENSKEYK